MTKAATYGSRRACLTLVGLCLAVAACPKPTVVAQGDARYQVEERDAETFVYVEYRWKGGKFDDALALEKRFANWGQAEQIFDYGMARFPTLRDWQLGFTTQGPLPRDEFEGHPIHTLELAAGAWARMHTRGEIDWLFRYWKPMRRWLRREGRDVDSPVFEVYPDLLDEAVTDENARGELRYHLSR